MMGPLLPVTVIASIPPQSILRLRTPNPGLNPDLNPGLGPLLLDSLPGHGHAISLGIKFDPAPQLDHHLLAQGSELGKDFFNVIKITLFHLAFNEVGQVTNL